ncbi:hypothetical protein AVEN_270379-1 [Araneus ventricosus]|uniref:Reverse transcriptase domain-containing protein n=1 Tax=Araneus ventricosus TaxID=182803 RepID=A0A4Y2V7Z2_ARAVE|nr:hypothetical protein AVEN_270379-1 [Araneus ventricosus]
MACYTKNISLSLVERIRQSVIKGKQTTKHSSVRFACPIRALQSYNGALLEYSMPICVPGNIIRLIATYLRRRHFAVRVGNSLSSERAITAGVVQGPKVGPYLFNIYVNDIPIPRNCQTKIRLFADDTAIMSTGASDHVVTHLNDYLDQLGTVADIVHMRPQSQN